MRRKPACLIFFALVAGLVPGAVHADIQTGLVGHWPLNEGTGKTTADLSGNGHDGTLNNGVTWITPGFIGHAAVRIDGNPGGRVAVGTWDPGERVTLAIWAKWTGEQNKAPRTGLIGKRDDWSDIGIRWFSEVMTSGEVRMRNYTQTVSSPAGAMTAHINEWTHVAITCDGTTARIYLNAQQVGSGAFRLGPLKTAAMGLGCKDGGSNTSTEIFSGDLDEARIYDRVLSVSDLKQLFEWADLPGKAQGPQPGDGQTDVARDVVLSWTPGEFTPPTKGHSVYFGESANDVGNASGAVAQDANTYGPPRLAFGKTYYWRVDAADKTPDQPLFKGDVWSFTVEPYDYPVRPVQATASSAQANMGPEKTIDGSGMMGDVHGTEPSSMWLSAGVQPNWIQYEFDKVYQLHEMRVWNSNQMIESFLGFGVKKVTIETSTDGTTWTPVANVPEFARASGAAGYAANTTVSLGPVDAKYVKLTITANWGGAAPQTGLSEVRFSYVPTQARVPQPATAARNVGVDPSLDWRPGRRAASHKVFFGTDQAAVAAGTAPAQTVTAHGFDPGPLNFGTTYYWKVDEVNAVTYPGSVWSFTTQEYAVVEDFESYTDKQGEEVFTAWADGMVNSNGSIVGLYPDAIKGTFCETTIVHGGRQSMPFEYNNVKPPYYSEAERTLDKAQDWTVNGADTLILYFRGNPAAFVEAAGKITMSGGGTDIWNNADQFRFACKPLAGDATIVAKIESVGNSDPWAKAGVMVRESLDPGSRFAIVLAAPGNGVHFQGRLMTGSSAVSDNTAPAASTPEQNALRAPVWVKLERKGSTFNGFYSADGVKWTTITWSPQTINMAGPVYIGLAVTSHNANVATTAVFSGVATTGNVTGSWNVQAIGVAQPANEAAPLYVTVQDSAGKSRMIVHPDPAATTLATWQAWRIPLSEISAGGVKLAAVKKLVIGVGDRASPKPDGAGKLYFDDIGFGHPAATKP